MGNVTDVLGADGDSFGERRQRESPPLKRGRRGEHRPPRRVNPAQARVVQVPCVDGYVRHGHLDERRGVLEQLPGAPREVPRALLFSISALVLAPARLFARISFDLIGFSRP